MPTPPQPSADTRRVLIVGGGIAGLSLARTLATTGVSLELIERERAWRPAGSGIYLPGNASRALRALGLETQVASRAVEIATQRVCDHRGRLLRQVDVAKLWAAVGPCLALGRAELHDVLLEAARDVPISMGVPVSCSGQADVSVDSATERVASGEYDLVVAADGINSTVRRLAFDPRRRTPARGPSRLALPRAPGPPRSPLGR